MPLVVAVFTEVKGLNIVRPSVDMDSNALVAFSYNTSSSSVQYRMCTGKDGAQACTSLSMAASSRLNPPLSSPPAPLASTSMSNRQGKWR